MAYSSSTLHAWFIFFEGCSLVPILRNFGYSAKKRRGFLYASADIYISFELPCKIMILIGIVIMFLLTVLLILLLINRLFLYKLEYYKFPAYKTSF